MTTKTKKTLVTDDYLQLILRFPLRKINGEKDNNAALEVLAALIGRDDLSPGERDYMTALATLVADYEKRARIPRVPVPATVLLKHLMVELGMTVGDVGAIIGSQPKASMILRGERSISKAQARRLAEHFDMEVGAFID